MGNMYLDGQYLARNPQWHAEDSAWKAGNILRILERMGIHPATVCEVGCGVGGVLYALKNKMPDTCRFLGLDISPQAIALASRLADEVLQFECADIAQDKGRRWDVLMLIDVIEHVDDYRGLLRAIKDKAQYKVLHIPLDLSVQTVLRAKPIAKNHDTVGHIHYFTKETALQALRDVGYDVQDYVYTATALDLPAKSLLSACARWPRKLGFAIHPDLVARVLGGFSLLVLAQ